jgi:hypothetical protein
MDVNLRPTINEAQLGNWCRTTTSEDQCIAGNKQSVGSGTTVEGVQRCFCMDIQRSKRDSTKANITQNWAKYYYTTSTSS